MRPNAIVRGWHNARRVQPVRIKPGARLTSAIQVSREILLIFTTDSTNRGTAAHSHSWRECVARNHMGNVSSTPAAVRSRRCATYGGPRQLGERGVFDDSDEAFKKERGGGQQKTETARKSLNWPWMPLDRCDAWKIRRRAAQLRFTAIYFLGSLRLLLDCRMPMRADRRR